MKKSRRSLSHLLALLVFALYMPGLCAMTWVGNTVFNVTDADLALDASGGNIQLPAAGTSINAINVDINITLTTGNVTVEGAPLAESQLYLFANTDRTITFDLSAFDLTFVGSQIGAPLLIVMGGQGTVVFQLAGGHNITFTSDLTHGPVEFYVLMQDTDEYTPQPTVIFKRLDIAPSQNELCVGVFVGPDSLISYLSSSPITGTDAATIVFNPSNQGAGEMFLDIANTGGYIIAGSFTSEPNLYAITLADIDRSTAAGRNAITRIINMLMDDEYARDEYTQAHGCLLVRNHNELCFDLLIDPFTNLGAEDDLVNFRGSFNGLRYGFVLGANATLEIDDNACLDYVGLTNNQCPCVDDIFVLPNPCSACDSPCGPGCGCDCDSGPDGIVKARNYSAFIVDGNYNPASIPAQIVLGEQSGIYFRSGVDCNGVFNEICGDPLAFIVAPDTFARGAGNVVFDVEGQLNVFGSNTDTQLNSRLEILSLQVSPSGGPLFPGLIGQTIFPLRTGAVDADGVALRYNKAAWLVNNRMTLYDTSLAHTDENHLVFQANDVQSEATYIGGERSYISLLQGDDPLVPRPKIAFINSRLHVYTDVAFTGLDLLVPNYVIDGVSAINTSYFVFYSNGYAVDNGTGREMILGTLIGSEACDGCSIINRDAHLDIIQDTDALAPLRALIDDQNLFLVVDVNSPQLIRQITGDISGQRSIHNLYLGNASNISIGTDVEPPNSGTGFTFNTHPSLIIAGNFFSFNTRGGLVGLPDKSNVTGQGGIFVDTNGSFGILPDFRASIATMVTKSGNGIVVLPKSQVVFGSRVGVANWQLNLTFEQPDTVLVGPDEVYSDYTLNWIATTKDWANYTPYEIGDVTVADCPPVLPENIASLPSFQGVVEQLQIEDSRIGDAVNFIIDGGFIREVLWLAGARPAEAATALIILQNNGRIGINTAHRNIDSIFTQTTLGVNGMSFVANGNGRIDLNEDVIINNICPFLKGPDFTSANTLEIYSDLPQTLRVTQDGILDFRSFNNGGTIRFSGNVTLLMEAGSTLIVGSATLRFTDNAKIVFDDTPKSAALFATLDATLGSINNAINPTNSVNALNDRNQYSPIIGYGTGVQNTDAFRIKLVGTGTIDMQGQSSITVEPNAYVGVETYLQVLPDGDLFEIPTTNLTIELEGASQFVMGRGNLAEGGSFQVGNTVDRTDHSVSFTLFMNGEGTDFVAGAGSFLGLGAGIVRGDQTNTTATFADVLFNTTEITFDLGSGTFTFDRIFESDDARSQAMVIGNVAATNISYLTDAPDTPLRNRNFDFLGGGNLYLITPSQGFNAGAMALINRLQDDVIEAPVTNSTPVTVTRMRSGVFASTALQNGVSVAGLTAAQLFEEFKVVEGTSEITRDLGLADAAPFDVSQARGTFGLLAYVDRGEIGRFTFDDVTDINVNGAGGTPEERRLAAYDVGALNVQVNTDNPAPGAPLFAIQLQ